MADGMRRFIYVLVALLFGLIALGTISFPANAWQLHLDHRKTPLRRWLNAAPATLPDCPKGAGLHGRVLMWLGRRSLAGEAERKLQHHLQPVPAPGAGRSLSEIAQNSVLALFFSQSCGSMDGAIVGGRQVGHSAANCRLRRRNKKGRKTRPFLNIHLPAGTSMVRPRTVHV